MSFNFSSIIDGNAGNAQGREGTTIQTLVISIASGLILFGVQFSIFLLVRIYPWAKRIYQPRSYLVPVKNRIKPPPNNPFKWIFTVFKVPAEVVLAKAGMDGYFFLRYLTMCLKIFFPMAIVILPILLPINRINGKGTQTINNVKYNVRGLDTLAWSNIPPTHTSRYWAHLILAICVIAWVCYMFHREMKHYVRKRQEYLSHPSHRLKASSNTVLITDIPTDLCTVEQLTEHYDDFPGGIRRIWINRDFEPLVKTVQHRNQLENQLENAETNLVRQCVKKNRKKNIPKSFKPGNEPDTAVGGMELKEGYRAEGNTPIVPHTHTNSDEHILPQQGTPTSTTIAAQCQADLQYDVDSGAIWTRYISPKKRATRRIPKDNHTVLFKIPLIGRLCSTKVDTIYFCRREVARLNLEVEKEARISETYPQIHSAFIQFGSQKAAHLACQALSHPNSTSMTRRTLELSPADINWRALGLPWWQRYLRLGGFILLFVVVIFVFGIISFFTGILSKASTLGSAYHWLDWISSLPSWLVSFIQGTLPPVILIVLLSGPLPIVLRLFTNDIRGAVTGSEGERSLQLWYFIFLLFELFIVPTISSGLTAVVKQLVENPTNVPNLLATNLPTAANYYFSFLIVEALSISASSILQTIRLLNYYILGSTNTPDSVFASLTFTNRTRIGSNIPWYTTYAVIGIVYSVIAPLMLVFMLITFGLFWFVIKNNLLYVVRTGNVDGGALFFPNAINQTFTGLYFFEVCLIGLFFLVRDVQDTVTCEAQGIIMVIALVCTVIYQWWLYTSLHPLYTYLPVTMEGHAQQRDQEYELEHLRDREEKTRDLDGEADNDSDGVTSESSRSLSNAKSNVPVFGTNQIRGQQSENTSEKLEDNSFAHRSGYRRPQTPPSKASTELTAASPRAAHLQARQSRDGKHAERILARLNRPVDDSRLAELEQHLVAVEHSVGNTLAPRREDVERQMMNDPISKIIMQHNDELEDLDAEERDLLISVAFTHSVLRTARPSVWIPQDEIGVSDDEIRRTRLRTPDVVIDNRGAFFNRRLKVQVNRPPPDMSEFALLMAEL